VTKVSLIGLRLGATLAAQTPLTASNLLLWEPVVSGRNYHQELREIHKRRFSDLLFPPRLPAGNCGGELLGFPLPLEMEADIKAIDLDGQIACRAEQVVLVVSEQRSDYSRLRVQLQDTASAGGPALEYHVVPDESRSEDHEEMLLSTQVLQVMAAALSRRAG